MLCRRVHHFPLVLPPQADLCADQAGHHSPLSAAHVGLPRLLGREYGSTIAQALLRQDHVSVVRRHRKCVRTQQRWSH